MAANNVVVTISAKDQLTGHLRGIRAEVAGMNTSLKGAGASISGLTAGFLGMAAGIATTAFALSGLGNALKSATSLELTSVSTAQTLMEKMGISAESATKNVKDLYKEISALSAQLPGSEEAYLAASNSASNFATKASGGDLKKMKELNIAASTVFGLSGAATGSSAEQTGDIVNRFLGGQESLSMLLKINSLQKDIRLTDAIKSTLKEMGKDKKDWEKLTAEQQGEFMLALKKKYATPDYIARLSDTADGYFQSIVATLFSPVNGLFGFMRDIPDIAGKGTTTALNSVKLFYKSITELFTVLQKKGGGVDPMVVVARMFDSFTKTIKDVTDIIDKGGKLWNDLTYAFTTKLTQGLDGITLALGKVDWKAIGFTMGDSIMKILTDEKLGIALEKAITGAIQGLADLVVGAIKGAGAQLTKELNGSSDFRSIVPGGIGETEGEARARRGLSKLPGDLNMYFPGKDGQYIDPNTLKPIPAIPPSNSSSNKSTTQASAVININGATGDNQQLAQMVMDKLNGMWQDRTNAALA